MRAMSERLLDAIVAAGRVWGKPFSGTQSLLIGKNTEKFADFASEIRRRRFL